MGCCTSSPHGKRRYRDPADDDEELVPIRYFGTFRSGSNLIPDDIAGLPSTHIIGSLPSDTQIILYEAEMDHGHAFHTCRLTTCVVLCCGGWIPIVATKGFGAILPVFSCDEMCCWVRKEYTTRRYLRIYSNRIETNDPKIRIPYGCLGCGSWNADSIIAHPFDRGAFGFTKVSSFTFRHNLCLWPTFGGVMSRHRCQCNGPLWNRMLTDCGGWWCDEWICQRWFCSYHYWGLADPDEVAFAASVALQAFFEGRRITPADMKSCLEFWNAHLAERTDPIRRKRPVCCEPYITPFCDGAVMHRWSHLKRNNPYAEQDCTPELIEAYKHYENGAQKQIRDYEEFHGPVSYSTFCRLLGCRRVFGRQGFFFCTEGCTHCHRKAGEPAPPMEVHDFDDDWDASSVLLKVLGPPPKHVVIRRWRWDPESKTNVLYTYSGGEELMEAGKDV